MTESNKNMELNDKLQDVVKQLNDYASKYGGLLAILGILLALISLLPSIALPAWLKLTIFLSAIWGTRRLFTSIWTFVQTRIRPAIPQGQIFPGIFNYERNINTSTENIFDRAQEIADLERTILSPEMNEHILAITGISGVGKSVLTNLLHKKLTGISTFRVKLERFDSPQKTNVEIIKDFIRFVEENKDVLSSQDDVAHTIIILDQFEVCLDHIIATYLNNREATKSLREYLTDASRHSDSIVRNLFKLFSYKSKYPRLKIVLTLRSDRYYDLRLLGELGQIPYNAFEVLGIGEGEGTHDIQEKLYQINFNPNEADLLIQRVKEQDGTILPVKMQIIGCMLERTVYYPKRTLSYSRFDSLLKLFSGKEKRRAHPRFRLTLEYFNDMGGSAGLIEKYLRFVIQSSPNPNIAREVLYVFGMEGRVKTRYTLTDLAEITFRDEDDLQLCIDHLSSGCLISTTHGQHALVHDYLAQEYNRLSGRLIDPVVRDNLAYSHSTFQEGRKRLLAYDTELTQARKKVKLFLAFVQFALLFLFSVRLLLFDSFFIYDAHQSLGFSQYDVSSLWSLDWHYLPILIAQFSWAFYVIELVRKIFVNVDETWSMKLGSYLLVATVAAGMVFTAFVPGIWLIWIGINGVLVGLKFASLGRKIRRCTSGRNRYSVIGFYTVINCLFVIYIGTIVYPYVQWDLHIFQNTPLKEHILTFLRLSPLSDFMTVYYAVIILMTYFIYMYRAHVRKNTSIEFIGLYKRVEAIA